MGTLADRLKELGGDKRGWQAALARHCGVKAPSVADWVSGRSKTLEGENLLKAAEFFNVRPAWLATGKGRKWASQDGAMVLAAEESVAQYNLFGDGLTVPILNVSASMGPGHDQHNDEYVIGRMTVSPSWVAKSLKPLSSVENLRFIHGYGDSMDPTFSDGDILLVDAGVQDVRIDGIYVLEAQDRLFIKRVRQRLDGTYEISSDNPNVKTVDVLDGSKPVSVRGRVVWLWNGRKI